MTYVSMHVRPTLTVESYKESLMSISYEFTSDTPEEFINRFVAEADFGPCEVEQYYSADCSIMPWVLQHRKGIPISLAIAAIEIGRLHGHEFVGIGMPGHFLLRERHDPTAFYDVFTNGHRMSLQDCELRFRNVQPNQPFQSQYLTPISDRLIVQRVLNNLQNAYTQAGERTNLLWVLELRSCTDGLTLDDAEVMANLLGVHGRFDEAAEMYDAIKKPREADHMRSFLN